MKPTIMLEMGIGDIEEIIGQKPSTTANTAVFSHLPGRHVTAHQRFQRSPVEITVESLQAHTRLNKGYLAEKG